MDDTMSYLPELPSRGKKRKNNTYWPNIHVGHINADTLDHGPSPLLGVSDYRLFSAIAFLRLTDCTVASFAAKSVIKRAIEKTNQNKYVDG